MVRSVSHVIHPFGALFVVFCKDVVALLQVFPDHLNFLGIGMRMNQILAKRKPQLLEMNTHGADLLAISAKGTAENGATKVIPHFFGGLFGREKIAKQSCPALQDLSEAFNTVKARQLPVLGGRDCWADVCTDPALGTCLHLYELLDAVILITHVDFATFVLL